MIVALLCLLTAPSLAQSAPSAPSESQVSALYVQASQLKVRDEPGGQVLGKLPINTAVRVLTERGDHVAIEGPDGLEGWVLFEFLSTEPLTVAYAVGQAESTEDPAERRKWAERAVAVDPRDPKALGLLAATHEAAGNHETSDQLRERLVWPDDILVAGVPKGGQPSLADTDGDGLADWLERQVLYTDHENAQDPGGSAEELARVEGIDLDAAPPLQLQWTWAHSWDAPAWMSSFRPDASVPKKVLRRLGIAPGDSLWVLPRHGPAVQGTVREVLFRELSSCGEVNGVVLQVDATLAEGDHPVAFTKAAPPKSWSAAAPSLASDVASAVSFRDINGDGVRETVHEAGCDMRIVAGDDTDVAVAGSTCCDS
ncbi:MAG: SH3 domain-containing protein [Proteobacteria bacterium]|nr:SH3 domain-containing protein [Pseudomonadota bacterium]